jgi:hypothetical protein
MLRNIDGAVKSGVTVLQNNPDDLRRTSSSAREARFFSVQGETRRARPRHQPRRFHQSARELRR